jgi:hypothetical protein
MTPTETSDLERRKSLRHTGGSAVAEKWRGMQLNRRVIAAAMVAGLVVAAVGYAVWKVHALPNGTITTNGRVEATQVDTSAAQALVVIFAIQLIASGLARRNVGSRL